MARNFEKSFARGFCFLFRERSPLYMHQQVQTQHEDKKHTNPHMNRKLDSEKTLSSRYTKQIETSHLRATSPSNMRSTVLNNSV